MEKKSNGRASLVVTIILLVIFVPIIVLNCTLIAKTYLQPSHLPGVFGVKPVIVLSGSMSPVFEADSLIFVKETDTSTLQEGDIVCYLQDGTAITHRIEQIVTQDGTTSYVTKGDANNTADKLAVTPDQVEGVYIGKIDGLGGVAMFAQSTTGMILFIALPIVLYLAFDIFSRKRESKREKQRLAELDAELAALRNEDASSQDTGSSDERM